MLTNPADQNVPVEDSLECFEPFQPEQNTPGRSLNDATAVVLSRKGRMGIDQED